MRDRLFERAAEAERLQLDGRNYQDACREAGIDSYSYSVTRRVLRLYADQPDNADLIEAMTAIKMGQTSAAEGFLRRVIEANGGKPRRVVIKSLAQQEKANHTAFLKAVDLIVNTCEHCTEVIIPHLEPEEIATALERLKESRWALMLFSRKIKETTNGNARD